MQINFNLFDGSGGQPFNFTPLTSSNKNKINFILIWFVHSTCWIGLSFTSIINKFHLFLLSVHSSHCCSWIGWGVWLGSLLAAEPLAAGQPITHHKLTNPPQPHHSQRLPLSSFNQNIFELNGRRRAGKTNKPFFSSSIIHWREWWKREWVCLSWIVFAGRHHWIVLLSLVWFTWKRNGL